MSNPVQQLADVVSLPVRAVGNQASSIASAATGTFGLITATEVDDWGRDNGFVNRAWQASRLRWSISVGGTNYIPKRTGALIVVNARRFALAPIFAALSIGAEVDRPVRFAGRPDVAPFGPVMQRLGGLLAEPRELQSALAAGELVVMGADHQTSNRRAGHVDHRLVGAAILAGVRVLPAAAVSVPLRRSARVEVGAPIRLSRKRRGPLDELETADALESHIDALLREFGGALTGTPLDWLPVGGIGGI